MAGMRVFLPANKILRFSSLILIIVLLILMGTGCQLLEEEQEIEEQEEEFEQEELEEEDVDDPLGLEPGQVVKDAFLTLYSSEGTTRWEVRGEEAVRRDEAQELTLEPVEVDSFLADGEGDFPADRDYDLTGDRGLYLEVEGLLTLFGEARLESENLTFTSADISWQQESDRISSEQPTEIFGNNFTATGSGFEAEADLSWFHLKGSPEERAKIVWEEE